jgi:hypothetical protein
LWCGQLLVLFSWWILWFCVLIKNECWICKNAIHIVNKTDSYIPIYISRSKRYLSSFRKYFLQNIFYQIGSLLFKLLLAFSERSLFTILLGTTEIFRHCLSEIVRQSQLEIVGHSQSEIVRQNMHFYVNRKLVRHSHSEIVRHFFLLTGNSSTPFLVSWIFVISLNPLHFWHKMPRQ